MSVTLITWHHIWTKITKVGEWSVWTTVTSYWISTILIIYKKTFFIRCTKGNTKVWCWLVIQSYEIWCSFLHWSTLHRDLTSTKDSRNTSQCVHQLMLQWATKFNTIIDSSKVLSYKFHNFMSKSTNMSPHCGRKVFVQENRIQPQ